MTERRGNDCSICTKFFEPAFPTSPPCRDALDMLNDQMKLSEFTGSRDTCPGFKMRVTITSILSRFALGMESLLRLIRAAAPL